MSGNKNGKNSTNAAYSNSFEVLGLVDERTDRVNDEQAPISTRLTSSRGRALKHTTHFEPANSPPRKRTNSTSTAASKGKGKGKATALPTVSKDAFPSFAAPSKPFVISTPLATSSAPPVDDGDNDVGDARFAVLVSIIEKQNDRIQSLESLIRDELLPRVADLSSSSSRPSPPSSPSPPSTPEPKPRQLPGIGLDLSHCSETVRSMNAGAIRERVDYALKSCAHEGVKCLGINDKGNGRYRLLFAAKDIDVVRRDGKWVENYFERARLYGEQWYPLRLDRVSTRVIPDEKGCEVFGTMNEVKVHKMRWLGKPVVGHDNPNEDPGYRSMVVYLDKLEEVNRLLRRGMATAPNGESAFTHAWEVGRQPARCYRCHQYGHLHYRCRATTVFCGQCARPGHSASDCTSTEFRCAACRGPHKASDSGCPTYRRELQKVRPSPLV